MAKLTNEVRRFYKFSRVEEGDDGTTCTLTGVAATEARASDGMIITAECMKAAIPGFLRADGSGPIREQHDARRAVGKSLAIHVDDASGNTILTALIVDSEAVRKCHAGVLQGFSIAGTVTQRDPADPSIVRGLSLREVSIVDRPADSGATFQVVRIAQPTPPLAVERVQPGEQDMTLHQFIAGQLVAQQFQRASELGADTDEQRLANVSLNEGALVERAAALAEVAERVAAGSSPVARAARAQAEAAEERSRAAAAVVHRAQMKAIDEHNSAVLRAREIREHASERRRALKSAQDDVARASPLLRDEYAERVAAIGRDVKRAEDDAAACDREAEAAFRRAFPNAKAGSNTVTR